MEAHWEVEIMDLALKRVRVRHSPPALAKLHSIEVLDLNDLYLAAT